MKHKTILKIINIFSLTMALASLVMNIIWVQSLAHFAISSIAIVFNAYVFIKIYKL